MSETPVPRDPGRDEDPPGVPAGSGDRPWLGSPHWRLVPQSPDWPEWMGDDAHADDEDPGDPDDDQDPDHAPPPAPAPRSSPAPRRAAPPARRHPGPAAGHCPGPGRRPGRRVLIAGVRVVVHPLRPVRALRHQPPARRPKPGTVTGSHGHAGRVLVPPTVPGNRCCAHSHDPSR